MLVAGGGAYFLLRTKGSPEGTTRACLPAWQRGGLPGMRAAVLAPPADSDRQCTALRGDLGVTGVQVSPGTTSKQAGKRATATFTAALTMAEGVWRYEGRLRLVTSDRKWKVEWSPEA